MLVLSHFCKSFQLSIFACSTCSGAELKPEEAFRNFYAFFDCLQEIRNFRTNHNAGSSLRQQEQLSKIFSANKTTRYSELLFLVLDRKRETDQNGKK